VTAPSTTCYSTWASEGGARYAYLARHLLLGAGGVRCRRPDLGRATGAEELPGRRDHQTVRRTRHNRRLDQRRSAAAGSTPPPRSNSQPDTPAPAQPAPAQATGPRPGPHPLLRRP
jgi:hypothetical protein